MSVSPSRRSFCVSACQAASCLALGSVLPACGGGSPTSPSAAPALPVISGGVSGNTVVAQIDSASPLAVVGGTAQVRSSAGVFLVARTSTETLTALTATCTHEACEINGHEEQIFVCPCHGSRFTSSGTVVNGPATRALRQFTTQFTNNVLTIVT